MDFETDPAADFLSRERKELADILQDPEDSLFSPMSNEDFELINSEIQQADAQVDAQVDDLHGMSFISAVPPKADVVPEKIRIWKEQMEKQLEEKDRNEVEAKENLRVSAQKEMTEWVTKYNETMERTKSMNRAQEQDLSPQTAEADAKNMWESITVLCDFSAKGPKSAKDATRMRSIFLQMKAAPKVN